MIHSGVLGTDAARNKLSDLLTEKSKEIGATSENWGVFSTKWRHYKRQHGIMTITKEIKYPDLLDYFNGVPVSVHICLTDPTGLFVLVPEEFALKVLALGGFP